VAEVRTAVIVCDHHPLIRAGIRAAIAAEPDLELVAELPAWPAAGPLPPALVVIERRLFAEAVGAGPPAGSCVITTDRLDGAELLSLVRRGVRGFVWRSGSGHDLVSAARSLARGHGFMAPEFIPTLLSAVQADPGPPAEQRCAGIEPLTGRERDVLRLLASGAGNREIAHALGIAERTVKFHVSNLLTKSRLRTRAQLIARIAAPS
jgi:DNA-binding NarL/FixJ family response regulator